MKAKGLLGGDHFPSCSSAIDGVRDDEEVIEKPAGKNLKSKSDSVDTYSTLPKKKAGCVITSPGIGYLRVAEDENDNVEEDDSFDRAKAVIPKQSGKNKRRLLLSIWLGQ